jgi:hypothetical protein
MPRASFNASWYFAMLLAMTEKIDLVYDRLIADEKLKDGTKYERLAAVVFRILTEETTVHDLRLKGAVGVPHQIDVVIGEDNKRILIEAKDYDRKASLPVVRDFSAVVADLKPDDAFVVSTVGFSANAQKWANAKGIKLAILRVPESHEDWGNLVTRIDFELRFSVGGDPTVQWFVDRSEADRFEDGSNPIGLRLFDDLAIGADSEQPAPLRDLLEPEIQKEAASIPPGEAAEVSGGQDFSEARWLHLPGEEPIKVTGYRWTQQIHAGTHNFSVGVGVGGLTAELVMRSLDGSVHRLFTNRQIASLTFDGKAVVPKGPPA